MGLKEIVLAGCLALGAVGISGCTTGKERYRPYNPVENSTRRESIKQNLNYGSGNKDWKSLDKDFSRGSK